MRSTLRSAVVVLALVLACSLASVALAQTGTPTVPPSTAATDAVTPAPLAEGVYQVQLAPDITPGQAAAIVAVQLPPRTQLPAMVRIPVPQGAMPTWVGEILGGDPTADPDRPYRMVQGTGGQVLEMTLEQTRSAQAEFTIPSTAADGTTTMKLTWIQAAPSERTEFSVRMPGGVSQVQIAPTPEGTPATNPLGETLYALPTKIMKPGETTAITVSYAGGQGSARQGQAGSASSGSTVLYALVGVFFLILAVLAFALMSNRKRAS